VRCIGDEALLSELRGEPLVKMIGRPLGIGVHRIFGDALEPMLSDDNGPPFAGFQILRDQQPAPGKDVGEDIERHLIGA